MLKYLNRIYMYFCLVFIVEINGIAIDSFSADEIFMLNDENHHIGFRNAGTYENALNEHREGFKGDSLCLTISPTNLECMLPNYAEQECLSGIKNQFQNMSAIFQHIGFAKLVLMQLNNLDNSIKNQIISTWKDKLNQFLSTPFVTEKSSFILTDYGNAAIFDVESYYGLGKFGRGQAKLGRSFAVIPPPTEEADKKDYKNYFRRMAIEEIKKYNAKLFA